MSDTENAEAVAAVTEKMDGEDETMTPMVTSELSTGKEEEKEVKDEKDETADDEVEQEESGDAKMDEEEDDVGKDENTDEDEEADEKDLSKEESMPNDATVVEKEEASKDSFYPDEIDDAKEEKSPKEEASSTPASDPAETESKISKEKSGEELKEENAPKVDQSGGDDAADEAKVEDSMDTEQPEKSQGEQVEEPAAPKEPTYSTRGRSTISDVVSGGDTWERGARESLDEIGRSKESISADSFETSFIESMSEEERRSRTRFLPDVEGMDVLRKNEVKEDLALARSLVSSASVSSINKSKGKRQRGEEDAMDVDEEATSPSEDDRSSDIARLGTSTIDFPSRDLIVPSTAFVLPPDANSSSSEDGLEGRENLVSSKTKNGVQSPLAVDSVTAFNPPRPPESIGGKKKHRMLRWERRPEDVEVDLNNYRKTVQRTRQELHSAESEYERLETIDAHLRWNFMTHLNLMNEEYMRLNEELALIQQDCVKAADLLTSRTRSRGAGKGSYVMRDVLTVLKTRGVESTEKDGSEAALSAGHSAPPTNVGVGGLSSLAFQDWDRETKIEPRKPASSWIVPGEKVKTPYGEGIVVEVQPAMMITKSSDGDMKKGKENGDKAAPPSEDKAGQSQKSSKRKKEKSDQKKGRNVSDTLNGPPSESATVIPPRVSVKLPYAVGHFVLSAIEPIENASVLSDAKLAKRWKAMVDTALSFGGSLDAEGILSIPEKRLNENEDSDDIGKEGHSQMEIDETPEDPIDAAGSTQVAKAVDRKLLPFGSGLLPTSSGRGNLLNQIPITDIEKGMQEGLYEGRGVLGKRTNPGVTADFCKWEEEEQEYLYLQASALHLRNALVRQKRIRLLNEKTNSATSDRSNRAEDLVSEMRADLKSLKHRLEEELGELGMDEESAEQILSSFYFGQDALAENGEVSPLKRKRRGSRRDDDDHMISDDVKVVQYESEGDRESIDDQGAEDLSGDDLEALRDSKKIRPNQ